MTRKEYEFFSGYKEGSLGLPLPGNSVESVTSYFSLIFFFVFFFFFLGKGKRTLTFKPSYYHPTGAGDSPGRYVLGLAWLLGVCGTYGWDGGVVR